MAKRGPPSITMSPSKRVKVASGLSQPEPKPEPELERSRHNNHIVPLPDALRWIMCRSHRWRGSAVITSTERPATPPQPLATAPILAVQRGSDVMAPPLPPPPPLQTPTTTIPTTTVTTTRSRDDKGGKSASSEHGERMRLAESDPVKMFKENWDALSQYAKSLGTTQKTQVQASIVELEKKLKEPVHNREQMQSHLHMETMLVHLRAVLRNLNAEVEEGVIRERMDAAIRLYHGLSAHNQKQKHALLQCWKQVFDIESVQPRHTPRDKCNRCFTRLPLLLLRKQAHMLCPNCARMRQNIPPIHLYTGASNTAAAVMHSAMAAANKNAASATPRGGHPNGTPTAIVTPATVTKKKPATSGGRGTTSKRLPNTNANVNADASSSSSTSCTRTVGTGRTVSTRALNKAAAAAAAAKHGGLSAADAKKLKSVHDKLMQFHEDLPDVPDWIAVRVQQILQRRPGRACEDGIKVWPTPVAEALKEVNDPQWMNYPDRVAAKINNEPFAKLSHADIEDYEMRMRAILATSQKLALSTSTNNTRGNFQTNFFINQVAGIKGHHLIQAHFPVHRTPKTLHEHEQHWHTIQASLRATDHSMAW